MTESKSKWSPVHLRVRVRASMRRETVKEHGPGRLSIDVKEPAEGNRANERVLAVVRSRFPNHRVQIVKGHHSPSKVLLVV